MSRCDALGADLSAFVDGECDRETQARVQAHLEGCADCREAVALWRNVGDRLRAEADAPRAFPRLEAAVAQRLAEARSARAPGGAAPIRRNPRPLRWLAAAGVLAGTGGLAWVLAAAADDSRRLADLEGQSRLEAMRQRNATEAMRLEIASICVKARAAGLPESQVSAIEANAKDLVDTSRRIEEKVSGVQSRLDRGGLLSIEWPKERG